MRIAQWLAGLSLVALAGPAWAQLWPGLPAPFVPGHGLVVTAGGKHWAMYGALGGYPAIGYRCYPGAGYGYPVVRTVVIVSSPVTLGVPVAPRALPALGDAVPLGREKDAVPFNPNDVRVIRPRPGGLKNLPPAREAVAAAPKVKAPPGPRAFEPRARLAVAPDPDKNTESERQHKLGREAFLAGEYGRAAECFAHARRLAPETPISYFLLAQAQLALGKFRDATESILQGLKHHADWPAAQFPVRELYGENAADHALHLELLRAAVERSADEPALLFLYGYQLWFNGRRDEARGLFRRAAPVTTDPKPIERFLAEPNGKMALR